MSNFYAHPELIQKYIENAVAEYNKEWPNKKHYKRYKNHRDYITKKLKADKCFLIWEDEISKSNDTDSTEKEYCFYEIFSFIFLKELDYTKFKKKWSNAKRIVINSSDLINSIKWLKKNVGREIELDEQVNAYMGNGWEILPIGSGKCEVLIDNHKKALNFALTQSVTI